MAWKVDGKIGYLATGQTEGNPQQDTYRILYQAPGQNTQTEIEKVYYLAPGGNPATDLQLVWHRYMTRTLLAGNQNVAIEYIPTEDISVTDIGIFTNENSIGRTSHVKIFHDLGLCVAAADGDVQTTNQVVYELNGSNHDAVIQATTLKAGQKYYIVYSHGYGSGNDFYPAYFQNTNGNYKVYENESSTSQTTVVDMSSFGNNLGNCSDITVFIEASENDYMLWSGNVTGYIANNLYVRSSTVLDGTYIGKIGSDGLDATELLSIGQFDEDDIFTWNGWDSGGLKQNTTYQRNSSYPKTKFKKAVNTLTDGYDVGVGNIFTYDTSFYVMNYIIDKITTLTENEEIRKTVECLMLCNDTKTLHQVVPQLWYDANRILRRKVEGQISKLSTTPLTGAYTTETLGAADGDILFVNYNFTYNDVHIVDNESIVKYSSANDSFIILARQHVSDDVWNNIFEKIESGLYTQHSVSDVLKSGTIDFTTLIKSTYTPDSTFLNATVNTDKKFYLKLNGNEV